MATLEKIRKRSVMLIVIIAVALLAFIVGDALTNSQNIFGNRSTVAEAGGKKIDITEYQAKRNELSEQMEMQRRQNPGAADQDAQLLDQQALDALIAEKLLDKAIDEMGIRVTPDQVKYFMIDNPQNPNVQVLVSQLNQSGIPVQNAQQAWTAIFQPQTVGRTEAEMAPFRAQWLALEQETKSMVARYTYMGLLQASVQPNDLDLAQLQADYNTRVDVKYAYKAYDNLDEKKYPVSESELRARYDKEKRNYMVDQPTKTVSFIRVDITPSAKDQAASKALAQQVITTLNGNAPLSKELKKQGVGVEKMTLRAADITDQAIKNFVTGGGDSLLVVRNDISGFEIVRMGSREEKIDSIQVNIVTVAGSTLPDRVMSQLNAGTVSIDSLTARFSPDSVMAQKEFDIPLFTAQGPNTQIQQSYLDSLYAGEGRYVILDKTDQGAVIGKLVKKNAPVGVYSYEVYTYRLKPSAETIGLAQSKFNKFLTANPTAKAFTDNASKAGYAVSVLDLTQSTPAIPEYEGMNTYLPESRQVVRWVMIDADKGDVSKIYECKDPYSPRLYAAAVTDEFDEYLPLNHRRVQPEITKMVRNEKAGKEMVKQYQAKAGSLDQVSQAMGASVTTSAIHFNPFNRGMVFDPVALGAMAGTKPGQKVKVVAGNDGVYAYQVTAVTNENNPRDDQMLIQQWQGFVAPDMLKMLMGTDKVKNYVYKFVAGE